MHTTTLNQVLAWATAYDGGTFKFSFIAFLVVVSGMIASSFGASQTSDPTSLLVSDFTNSLN